ncbi:MAG: DUF86 domain-containing protein [Treponema sp.]|jgi:uncharacterized protein with HEPN domain|nr:DUF86 domain-containing protein [Treponema sp.]
MDKDNGIISHIIEHIENAYSTQKRFGSKYEQFVSDKDYFNSVCMSLLQIGELANHLSQEFTVTHPDIPWRNIVALRNVVVHGYGQLDAEIVWASLTDDLPEFHRKCKAIIDSVFR